MPKSSVMQFHQLAGFVSDYIPRICSLAAFKLTSGCFYLAYLFSLAVENLGTLQREPWREESQTIYFVGYTTINSVAPKGQYKMNSKTVLQFGTSNGFVVLEILSFKT